MFRRCFIPVGIGFALLFGMLLTTQEAWSQCVGPTCSEWDLSGEWNISGSCEDDPSTPQVETSTGQIDQDDCDVGIITSENTSCTGTIAGNKITAYCVPDSDPPVNCTVTISSNTFASGTCSLVEGEGSCDTIYER